MEKKSPGQIAYEADCKRKPYYHPRVDGTLIPRRPWQALGAIERWSWEKNPTPRDWKESDNGKGKLARYAPGQGINAGVHGR